MAAPNLKTVGTRSFRLGQMDFLILELGPDQDDSLRFKKGMEAYGLGRDLTPPLAGVGRARKGDLTYLSDLKEADFVTPQFENWIKAFARCRPVILYISGHHAESRPIFYNDQHCGVSIERNKLKVGKYYGFVFMDIFTDKRQVIEAPNPSLSDQLGVLIGDACTLVSPDQYVGGTGLRLQEALTSKPLILGFIGKAPAAGTGPLHDAFLRGVHAAARQKPVTEGELITCWLRAGRLWSGGKYKKNLGALDSSGRTIDYRGKVV